MKAGSYVELCLAVLWCYQEGVSIILTFQMGTCSSERLENVPRVTSAQWQPHLLDCTVHLNASQALGPSHLHSCGCLRPHCWDLRPEADAFSSPDPTARVGRLWTQGRETWLQGQEFAFCVFQCPHLFRASIWQHRTICTKPLAKPRLSPTHTHILTLVRCTSVTEGMTPAWISSTYMKLSYSGKSPEVRRQHEPDKLKFKPALSNYLAENNDIGCITEKPGSAWPEHEMVLLASRKEGTRPDL